MPGSTERLLIPSNLDETPPQDPLEGAEGDVATAADEVFPPVRITGWASGGEGVGRLSDGRVVFVEGAVLGDLVEVAELESRKKMARGKVGRLVEASDARVEPECGHFGHCGGCVWQHVRYSVQLEAKQEIVRNALARIGGIDYASEIEIEGSPKAYGYRARARVVASQGGVGYRMRGGRRTFPISECPILVPSAQRALADLNAGLSANLNVGMNAASKQEGPAEGDAEKPGRRRPANEWVLTAGSAGDALVQQKISSRTGGRARAKAARRSSGKPREDKGPGSPTQPDSSSPSSEGVLLEVLGERLRARTASFVQGNALLWDAFAKAVRSEALCDPKPARFVELYAGIGFFTLPLARAGLSGVAIESESSATADLTFNLAANGLSAQVDVITARAEKRGDLAQYLARAELLLVDPPRTGLEGKVRDAIVSSGPKRLIYVSCDAGTWARDISALVESAYRLEHVQAFDLFPQTPHVEIVSRLERND